MVVKGEIKDERTKHRNQAEIDNRKRIGRTTIERILSVQAIARIRQFEVVQGFP